MNYLPFIGRQAELNTLQRLLNKKTASLVVIKGRRRIGKSRLIEEFAKKEAITFYQFSGLAPVDKTTAQSQRDEFAAQLSQQTGLPELKADDWSKLFLLLADKTKTGRIIILFDEISWMGSKDPDFLGKLKNVWDTYFKKNPKLILILCGSISSWIEKNIISSTGFFGRISLKLTLEELSLSETNALLSALGFKRSSLEKFMLLSVIGGIPWYVEQIDPLLSAEDNIKKICFSKDGLLVDEFKYIFHDLFEPRRAEICKKIVSHLTQGPAEYSEIVEKLNYHSSGSLSEYLNDLLLAGFIKRDYTWLIKTGKESQLSKYRLSDNYLRFYLKYIAPKLNHIKKGLFAGTTATLSNWNSIMGLQFENLVLNNRKLILRELNLKPEDVLAEGPFFQRKTVKQKGCQIDYLIQTKYNSLFVCEIKFSRNNINSSVITEVKEKISRLTLPRGFACMPVLIHNNELTEDLIDDHYFFTTIHFDRFL